MSSRCTSTGSARDAVVAHLGRVAAAFPERPGNRCTNTRPGHHDRRGYFVGTNTGLLEAPTGESIPPTGNRVRARECDIATVQNGVVTSHRFYFDMLDWLTQLGLATESAA